MLPSGGGNFGWKMMNFHREHVVQEDSLGRDIYEVGYLMPKRALRGTTEQRGTQRTEAHQGRHMEASG